MISRVSHFSSSTSGMGSGLVIEDHVRRGKADHKHQELLLKVQGCHICLLSVEVNCVVPLHGRTAYDVAEVHLWLETGVFMNKMPQSHIYVIVQCAILMVKKMLFRPLELFCKSSETFVKKDSVL